MITLLADAKGELYTCSQLQDYLYQGPEMESCCLLAFTIDTWEESYKEGEAPREGARENKGGQPAHICAHYLEEHPKMWTHCCVYRAMGHSMLPQIAGPWFPCNDDADTYNFYCACMLALLKPWHSKEDLKKAGETWPTAFATFWDNASSTHKCIIAGIQYYYKSKSACDTNRAEETVPCTGGQRGKGRAVDMDDTNATFQATEETCIPVAEQDLIQFQQDQVSPREEAHVALALEIAATCGIFSSETNPQSSPKNSYCLTTGDNERHLLKWLTSMQAMTKKNQTLEDSSLSTSTANEANVTNLSQALFDSDIGHACLMADLATETSSLDVAAPNELLEDQRHAYDIIDWYMQQHISGKCPKQMRMLIPGEAGVGKLKTIQTITTNFVAHGISSILVKAAYTGLAASVIDRKTLHCVAMLPLHRGKQSAQTIKQLEEYWQDKHYLIIDEISMVSCDMFAKLSSIISCTKAFDSIASDEPFGGLNIILVGNFHQFPLVAAKPTTPLYCPCNAEKDTDRDIVGRKLYEQFDVVVRLKTQV